MGFQCAIIAEAGYSLVLDGRPFGATVALGRQGGWGLAAISKENGTAKHAEHAKGGGAAPVCEQGDRVWPDAARCPRVHACPTHWPGRSPPTVTAYGDALKERTRERVPLDWAMRIKLRIA
jgi:hypothetical protein